jgi:hypothetical protein
MGVIFADFHLCGSLLSSEDLDKKNSIDVIYLDFQKAFDTLPHKRLIHKLKGYGINGILLLWIKDFLHERKQRVVLNGQRLTMLVFCKETIFFHIVY